ncbi:type II secretion system F family protein [Tepidibacillus fermentans]|uniref:Tight adherence protein B n=1 Tax=Tepidibacillus fermentans TaxID=1281767 RepID=A0A4R3KIT8_9BACI|nr:type II secretion system F family protein [Tepidibacillus fermentans]TCS83332.1 tight adherence protein B [Tepidibacillus fermentans]
MKWVVLLSFFFFSFSFFFWLVQYLDQRRSRIRKRVHEIEKKEWQVTEETTAKAKRKEKSFILARLFERIFYNLKWLRILDEKLQVELKRANLLMKSSEFMSLTFLFVIFGGIVGTIIAGGHIERGIWFGGITWIFPSIWLKNKIKKRKRLLEMQLPEMINMISNSLKAGYSLIQSLELLSQEMSAPLSEEIQRMLQEMRIGVPTEDALIHFNQRIDSQDLDLIITAMLIQRQVGGNLSEILDTIGETIRERIRIQGEIKSLTAQGRMSMIIFMLLPIGLGIFIGLSNPEYIKPLFVNPLGWAMMTLAFMGQIIGALLIKKITSIEV